MAILATVTVTHCAGTKSAHVHHSKDRYVQANTVSDLIALELNLYEQSRQAKKGPKSAQELIRTEFDIPFVMNDKVEDWIRIFTTTLRDRYSVWLSRAGRYLPYMEHVLSTYGVPKDLVYLSMIESGLNPSAYSHASAAGLWQFIRSTGKLYGLTNDDWLDERFDVIKATHAGARHLRDLYQQYGNWYLAFAAYNAGPGKVNRAIKTTGSRDFWTISRHSTALRQETKDYVPKILAAAYIAKNAEKFGLHAIDPMDALAFETVRVEGGLDIETAAKCAGTELEWMKAMNAELKRGITPPNHTYALRVPMKSKDVFEKAYAQLSPQEKHRFAYGYDRTNKEDDNGRSSKGWRYHKVKRNETVASVAKKYGVSSKQLIANNKIGKRGYLRTGQTLRIPSSVSTSTAVATATTPSSVTKTDAIASLIIPTAHADEKTTYTVRKGDTLGKIAAKNQVSIAQLKTWNPKIKKNQVVIGQKLALYTAGTSEAVKSEKTTTVATASTPAKKPASASEHRYYKVKRGDTLWNIAKQHSADVNTIKKLNSGKIKGNQIKVGMTLAIPVSKT